MLLIIIMNTFKTFRLNNVGKRFVINKNNFSEQNNITTYKDNFSRPNTWVIYDVSEGTEATNDPDPLTFDNIIDWRDSWKLH